MGCYCNSKKEFDDCCEPIILGKKAAITAEQLMRSRYSAYAVANINYILNSHHAQTRPTKERKSILKWAKSVKWLGLEIVSVKQGRSGELTGFVEFKAFFEENGKKECIHENSYFEFEGGQWYYKSGTHK